MDKFEEIKAAHERAKPAMVADYSNSPHQHRGWLIEKLEAVCGLEKWEQSAMKFAPDRKWISAEELDKLLEQPNE